MERSVALALGCDIEDLQEKLYVCFTFSLDTYETV